MSDVAGAPKEWRGRYFEDIDVRDPGIRLPNPVFVGDTIWAERESRAVADARA
jgi:hypothetical protein